MKKLTTMTALALAALGAIATAASAASVDTNDTDLILGFRITDTAGTGGSSDLEVDLGSTSQFTSTAAFTLNGTTGLSVNDLVSTYGSTWATRSDLTFGAAGVTSSGNTQNSFLVTEAVGSDAPSNSNLAVVSGVIGSLSTGLAGTPQTANSTDSSVIGTTANPASKISNSYTGALQTQAGNDYTYFPHGSTESGLPVGTLDLYSYVQSPGGRGVPTQFGTLLGTLTLDAAGDLAYKGVDATVAPEPSTYAMVAGAMGLLFLGMRRRQSMVG
jgi:hypothetical protein